MRIPFVAAIVLIIVDAAGASAGITFTPGHYYSSATFFERNIFEYDQNGTLLGGVTIPASLADEIRGLAFGPDGLLYATALRGFGFAVLALDSSGAVQETYPYSIFLGGNLAHGKLAVDDNNIYVPAGSRLVKFQLGDPLSGSILYNSFFSMTDVDVMPSGNLLVAAKVEVREITNNGTLIRTISLDRQQSGQFFSNIQGIEFNPDTNDLFVTHNGHTGFFHQLMRVDASTGMLEETTTFSGGPGDLFLTESGNLLVGHREEMPRLYSQDLEHVGTLNRARQMFVTQYIASILAGLDIRPGGDQNPVNLKSQGVLPVALLTTDEFDALQVDLASIVFGDPVLLDGGAIGVGPLRSAEKDVNGDGLTDLTLKFSMRDLVDSGALGGMSMEAILTGALLDGTSFEGSDSIRLVPPGDANNDQIVNAADYTIWADNFGTNGANTPGDFDENNHVNAGDYITWANNFGTNISAPGSAAAAVPEPSTLVLSAFGLIGLLAYGWRRRREA